MAAVPESYPVTLTIDYPDRNLNRLTSFFRIFMLIPIAILLGLLAGFSNSGWHAQSWTWGIGGAGVYDGGTTHTTYSCAGLNWVVSGISAINFVLR